MPALPSRSTVGSLAAVLLGALALARVTGWVPPDRLLELSGLLLVAMTTACLRVQVSANTARAIMPPAFVVVFTALLLLGPAAAAVVAAASALTAGLVSARSAPLRMLVHTGIAIAAAEAAGYAYQALAGVSGVVVWPWRALPVAVAVVAYHLTQGVLADVAVPLVSKRQLNRSWPAHALAGCSVYLLGAAVAAVLAELIDRRMWDIAPVIAVALVFTYRTYADYVDRLQEEHRRREVIDHLEQGMAVLNGDGLITLWNDALEHMLNCPRERAFGRPLADAVPLLARTELPRAIRDTVEDRQGRTVKHLKLAGARSTRIVQVKVLPVADGVALLWQDATERTRAEHELKRSGERLALAAEGANDGLWQWNLQTQEFYVSGRWRAMIGLPAHAAIGGPAEWLDRVHADDHADLNAALQAHLSGATQVFQHDHRIRHEDGTYRRFLCRGVAVSAAGRKPDWIAGSLTDTTEQAIAQERLRSVGFLDSLTGLFNRAVFVEGLGRRLDECRRPGLSNGFAVLYLDLDRFKIVNDSLGHMVGDELLVAVSRRLESCLRPGDSLARLGGDEFAILLKGLNDDVQANAIAGRIQDSLGAPFSIARPRGVHLGQHRHRVRARALHQSRRDHARRRHGHVPRQVARQVPPRRVRRRHARARARPPQPRERSPPRHRRQRLRSALPADRVADDGHVRRVRVAGAVDAQRRARVARHLHPDRRGAGADRAPRHVGAAARRAGRSRTGSGSFPTPASTASPSTCRAASSSSRTSPASSSRRSGRPGLRPADLRVEITETALLDSPGEAALVLRELRDFGVKVYLDDFGTGYSSLSHLHKLPVDALKIDRSFVNSLLLPGRPAIVESILALARTLKTSVVAEGIESEVQARELERLGCTHAQGFLFSRPLSMSMAQEVVMAGRPLGPKGIVGDAGPAAGPVPLAVA